jgi:tetratricopeptide (TPR) repeat protein/uncharacterized DUF497 family protein
MAGLALKCLEPLTAIGCGLAAFSLNALDGGLLAGTAIGGVGLIARFKENCQKHGLDAPELAAKMQMAVLRQWDVVGQTQEERDIIIAADNAMRLHLESCMLTRDDLAVSSIALEPYPARASRLVAERLAVCDVMFADGGEGIPLARRFAMTVIEAALNEALTDPAYASVFTLDLVLAGNAAHAVTHGKLDRQDAKLDALLALVQQQAGLDETRLSEIAVILDLQPDAKLEDVIARLRINEEERKQQADALAAMPVTDNLVRSYQTAAAEQLRAHDDAAAIALMQQARAVLRERLLADGRTNADFAAQQAAAYLRLGDVEAADRCWSEAEALLKPLDLQQLESLLYVAALALHEFGEVFGKASALDAAISRWLDLCDIASSRNDVGRRAAFENCLGNALSIQGERAGGEAGITLLADAVAAYRSALLVYTEAAMPADWAVTQNNLGNALRTQGERTPGEAGLKLLADAATAFRAALTVRTETVNHVEHAMTQSNLGTALETQGERIGGAPGLHLIADAITAYRLALKCYKNADADVNWGMTQSNLGAALSTQGDWIEGEAGLKLLADAAMAYRAALTVLTETDTPVEWATTQNSLGNTLRKQGDRTTGEAGIELLALSVMAYRTALRTFTETEMPAQWAMTQNNLSVALFAQGGRIGGDAGLERLADAVTACRMALTVRTETAMPAQWAMTQNNLGLALGAQGQWTGGSKGLKLVEDSVAAFLAALTVRTRTAMPSAWAMTQNNLGLARSVQGELTDGEAGLKLLRDAMTSYRMALTVWSEVHSGHYHGLAMRNLAKAEALYTARNRG